MRRVGFFWRLGAFFLDWLVLGVLIAVLAIVIVTIQGPQFAAIHDAIHVTPGHRINVPPGSGVFFVALLSLIVLYELLEVFWARTPGKMLCGIIIRNEDGSPSKQATLWSRFFLRHSPMIIAVIAVLSGSTLALFAYPLAALIIDLGMLLIFGPSRQVLHDKIAGTAVYAVR